MASITVPAPGTKYGPCVGDCKHVDCIQHREDSHLRCLVCHSEIGYDNPYMKAPSLPMINDVVHASCHPTNKG